MPMLSWTNSASWVNFCMFKNQIVYCWSSYEYIFYIPWYFWPEMCWSIFLTMLIGKITPLTVVLFHRMWKIKIFLYKPTYLWNFLVQMWYILFGFVFAMIMQTSSNWICIIYASKKYFKWSQKFLNPVQSVSVRNSDFPIQSGPIRGFIRNPRINPIHVML